MQVAQTSALTDRQGEERRILDLENAVKSVSLMINFNKSKVQCMQILCNVTTVTLVLYSFAVASFGLAHCVFLGV